MSKAKVLPDFTTIDALTAVDTVTIKAANLRAGMVLVDPEFNTPAAGIDHRVSATRGTGEIAFLVADLEAGGWHRQAFNPRTDVKVMA